MLHHSQDAGTVLMPGKPPFESVAEANRLEPGTIFFGLSSSTFAVTAFGDLVDAFVDPIASLDSTSSGE